MFNALWIYTPAEGLAEETLAAKVEELRQAGAELTNACIVEVCPENSSTNAGAIFCEMSFADETEYAAACDEAAWQVFKGMPEDEAFAGYEFAAFRSLESRITRDDCTCHRVMVVRIAPQAKPEMIDAMLERLMVVDQYVPGLANLQISECVESGGSGEWNYVYDCDFTDPAAYLNTYMRTPYHWGYLRLAQSDCVEYVMASQLSPFVVTEGSFLTMLG